MIWLRTFLLGLGFMSIQVVWPLYDSFVTLYYQEWISSGLVVGLLMAMDNFLGLTLQPYVGALSDQTRTRLGRRVPYLVAGAPVAALFLALIPFAREAGLWPLVGAAVGLNLAMASFRSPTVALMPDVIPPYLRSQANGIINWMGALGAALALLLGSQLYPRDPRLPFAAAAALLVAVALVFLFGIREPAVPQGGDPEGERPQGLWAAARSLARGLVDPQARRLLLAVAFWSGAFQGTSTWFTTFATQHLGLDEGDATFSLLFFTGALLLFALPAGWLGGRLGRRPTMAVGAALMAIGVAAVWFAGSAAEAAEDPWPLRLALLAAGTGHSLMVVQTYPALVQMAPPGQTGAYTGLYYIVSQIGGILAPPVFGQLRDWLGWAGVFAATVLCLLVASATALTVRGAEALLTPEPGKTDGRRPGSAVF
ncbi:MAG: MFS transporter [Firmicutes bacterium]|nr:MFS transporter [Bacillota bacterium]